MNYDETILKAAGISGELIEKLREHAATIPQSPHLAVRDQHLRADVRDVSQMIISVPGDTSLSEFKITR